MAVSLSGFPVRSGYQIGSWTTVARSCETPGEERSSFSRRMRVRRDGVYRARVYPDDNHAAGTSGSKTLDAH
jgi:hypothetical protein